MNGDQGLPAVGRHKGAKSHFVRLQNASLKCKMQIAKLKKPPLSPHLLGGLRGAKALL